MRITVSQQKFLDSDEAKAIRAELTRMESDKDYNTQPMYAATLVDDKPFVERHMTYLSDRPKLDPQQFLRNLKLMTRIKR